jgi:hypothetical protein
LSTVGRPITRSLVKGLLAALTLAPALVLAGLPGCEAQSPPRGIEATCAKACEVKATHCSAAQCGRGCNFVMDRLAEGEGDTVLACVAAASASGACDDRAWARCATRVGPHADGGPPPPPPPKSILEQDGD